MNDSQDTDALVERLVDIIEQARRHVARSINTAMVQAYWHLGREIVTSEQQGHARAEYGEMLVRSVAQTLQARYGRGFSYSNVKRMKQFFLSYPSGSRAPVADKGATLWRLSPVQDKGATVSRLSESGSTISFPSGLSWSHYCLLIRIDAEPVRTFYEIEAVQASWSVRELERQIGSLLYERLARSRDEAGVKALSQEGQVLARPSDAIKDPLVLEFLDLEERAHWRERDMEQAIIDRLETFLLELGKGFCFVSRQKRLTVDGDHFYVDLVFYNRLLSCFVLIDLKLGKLTHQDLGQMQMYVNYFDRHECEPSDSPTAGIVLCSDKNDAMVKITLPETNPVVHAARYQLYLPTESELQTELTNERAAVEAQLRSKQFDVHNGEETSNN